MDQLNGWGHEHATAQQRHQIALGIVHRAFEQVEPKIVQAVELFLASPISPKSFCAVELALLVLMRTLGRMILQATIQALEPDDPQLLPPDLYLHCGGYRQRNEKTRIQSIATRFGNITLWRRGYRPWGGDGKTIFPLEMMLGLTERVSPALLDTAELPWPSDLLGRHESGCNSHAAARTVQRQDGSQATAALH